MSIRFPFADASAFLLEYLSDASEEDPVSAALTGFPVASVMLVGEFEADCDDGRTGLPIESVTCVGDEVLARRVVTLAIFDVDLVMMRCIVPVVG
jgi:hypothetical protein